MLLPLAALLLAAGPNPYLSQAKVLHQGLDFEKCLKRLQQATRWENSNEQLAEIELYSGLCQFGLGHERDANEHFEMGLKIDPKLALPPLVGPKISALFQKAQAKVLPRVASQTPSAPPPEPPPPPPPKKVELTPEPAPAAPVEPVELHQEAPKHERHVVAPLAVLGVSAAAAVVAIVFGAQAKSYESKANAGMFESDSITWGATARTDALVANVCWAVAGAALIAAIITFFVAR
jgi:hypothetical protein